VRGTFSQLSTKSSIASVYNARLFLSTYHDITCTLLTMPPATRARLVRRAPLIDRVAAYLNPLDFLLWLSEELNSNDWDDFQRTWSIPTGITMNVAFMIARSNSRASTSTTGDDVFGDSHIDRGSGWLSWLVRDHLYFSYSTQTSRPLHA